MSHAAAASSKAIVVEQVFPHPPEKIWRALTDASLVGRWLMPNDFRPVVGHRFTFRSQPMGDWNGIVECEVLEVVPNERLGYSWQGLAREGSPNRLALDSTVTWTLTRVDAGTRVRMVHDGFRPENEFGYQAMSGGWPRVVERLGEAAGAA